MDGCGENKYNELQRKHYSKQYEATSLESKRTPTLWNWCRHYPLRILDRFLSTLEGSTALIVCAGQGLEVKELHDKGLIVTATDLMVEQLQPLLNDNIVADISVQDAEKLTYDSESFDYGLVNAGLHHLEHPHVGLCELIRCAKKGVLFIEAQDSILHALARTLGRRHADFEPAGNYVYRWKRREIEKICYSVHVHSFATKTYFLPIQLWMQHVVGFRKRITELILWVANIVLGRIGNGMITIIFKEPPSVEQVSGLRKAGFHYHICDYPSKM